MMDSAVRNNGNVWSFFSGAMGLDIGLELSGLHVEVVVEHDKWCCNTIRLNKPNIIVIEDDVANVNKNVILSKLGPTEDVFLMAGGPPCQSFSTGGNRAALSDPRGNLIFEYFRLINEIRPKYFIFENVANLITATLKHRPIEERPGKRWNLSSYHSDNCENEDGATPLEPEELSGAAFRYLLHEIEALKYSINFGILNSADYGAPQKRLRFVMIGCRDHEAPKLPLPTHGADGSGLMPLTTVRDAIEDLIDDPGEHSIYTDKMAEYFNLIPTGMNWRCLSEDLQREVLGKSFHAGGGKTGFMRRLDWDSPSPTLTTKANRKGTAMCHPSATRPLSVKEYSRIQGFPDDWKFAGAMNQIYQQIGNAVPTALGKAVSQAIVEHYEKHKNEKVQAKPTQKKDLEIMLHDAVLRLRSFARNNVKPKKQQLQLELS